MVVRMIIVLLLDLDSQITPGRVLVGIGMMKKGSASLLRFCSFFFYKKFYDGDYSGRIFVSYVATVT